MRRYQKFGFTLIELLIVIAILTILSTLGLNNFRSARIKATDLNRKSDFQTIAKSLEAYANDHRSYPLSDNSGKIICIPPDQICNWGAPFSDGTTTYITTLPGANQNYYYESLDRGISYVLYTHLNNTQDPDIISLDESISAKCGVSTPCNYQVRSTNK